MTSRHARIKLKHLTCVYCGKVWWGTYHGRGIHVWHPFPLVACTIWNQMKPCLTLKQAVFHNTEVHFLLVPWYAEILGLLGPSFGGSSKLGCPPPSNTQTLSLTQSMRYDDMLKTKYIAMVWQCFLAVLSFSPQKEMMNNDSILAFCQAWCWRHI